MTQPDLFRYHDHTNASESKVARDEGIARVTKNNLSWVDRATIALRWYGAMHSGEEVTGEQLRAVLLDLKFPKPTHVNAWGALIRSAASAGIIEDTGRVTQTTTKQSHARLTRVWTFK
jgi:hypothetical protein